MSRDVRRGAPPAYGGPAARRVGPGRHGVGDRRGRLVLVFLLVAVLAVTSTVLLGRRSRDGYPVIVQPAPIIGGLGGVATSGPTTEPTTVPATGAAVAPPAPPTVSPSPRRRATPRPTASTVRRTPPPSPAGRLTARYAVVVSGDDFFAASIELTNGTAKRQSWSVRLVHRRDDVVRVKEIDNGSLRQGGATINVFVGDDIEPGDTLRVGFRATKGVDRPVQPTSCLLNDEDPCRIG